MNPFIPERRDSSRLPGTVALGELPLRAPEARAALQLDPWFQSFVVNDQATSADERKLTLSLGTGQKGRGLEIVMPATGLVAGDLAPRADGNRSYELYTESVALALR